MFRVEIHSMGFGLKDKLTQSFRDYVSAEKYALIRVNESIQAKTSDMACIYDKDGQLSEVSAKSDSPSLIRAEIKLLVDAKDDRFIKLPDM
jgi:hypothetical protein